MDEVTAGRCHWPLEEPRHGAAVTVVITCLNRVQIQTSITSQPAVVLLHLSDVSHVSLPVCVRGRGRERECIFVPERDRECVCVFE